MEINILISTGEREKTIKEIIYRTKPFTVTEIAKKIKFGKPFISKFLSILLSKRIVKKRGRKFVISKNNDVKSVKLLFNINKFNERIFTKYEVIKAVGLYGSWAKGDNNENSDLDLWIKVKEIDDSKIAKINSEVGGLFRNTDIVFLDEKKKEHLKKKDVQFYHSLVFGSIMLYGDINEIY